MSYLDEQGVSLYLRDALMQLKYLRRNKPMKTSPSATPFETNQIAQFLAEYCRSVQFGCEILHLDSITEYSGLTCTEENSAT